MTAFAAQLPGVPMLHYASAILSPKESMCHLNLNNNNGMAGIVGLRICMHCGSSLTLLIYENHLGMHLDLSYPAVVVSTAKLEAAVLQVERQTPCKW